MSDRRTRTDRPAKPYPEFPLFPHATGRWAKKIRGHFEFFGPWADPQGALQRYLAKRDYLHAGMVPPSSAPAWRGAQRGTAAGTGGGGGVGGAAAGGKRARRPDRGPTLPHAGPGPTEAGDGGDEEAGAAGGVVAPRRSGRSVRSSLPHGPAGQTAGGLELRDLVNHFLTAKQRRQEAGDMGLLSFSEYHSTAGRVVKFFGKHCTVEGLSPDDFGRLRAHLAETRGPVSLGNEIGRVRAIFKHGYDTGLLEKPMRFGPEFSKPSRRTVRLARRPAGERMYEAEEVHALLAAAGPQMRAMILLGLNAAMGNTDVATLTRSAVNLKTGMVVFPRPKTGVARRAVLWPETVEALRALEKVRPKPKDPEHEDLVFVTRFGQPWVRVRPPGKRSKGKHQAVVKDSVAMEFRKVARAAGAGVDGRGFYALRHTFRTVADEVGDRRAIDLVMGHENGADIANHYVERIGDDRLRAVAEHVRKWFADVAQAHMPEEHR